MPALLHSRTIGSMFTHPSDHHEIAGQQHGDLPAEVNGSRLAEARDSDSHITSEAP